MGIAMGYFTFGASFETGKYEKHKVTKMGFEP